MVLALLTESEAIRMITVLVRLSKKKGQVVKYDLSFFVTPPGFEPRQAVPKTDVLPLHHGAIEVQI